MTSKAILIFVSVLLFSNCNETQKTSPNITTAVIDTFRKASNIIKNTGRLDFELATPISEIDLSHFELFGKFFHDRVVFYTSNNNKTNILNAKVKKITLCFIDGILAKSNYQLSENISSHLINTYGKFRFTPLNWENKGIAKNEQIVSKLPQGRVFGELNPKGSRPASKEVGKYSINPKLNRYKLKWSMDDKIIIYTNKESHEFQEEIYTYSEVLNHYKAVFNEVEARERFSK